MDKYLAEAAAAELPSSEDEADIEDADTCSASMLAKKFRFHYPKDEASLSLQRDYVSCLCADTKFTRLVAGLTNSAVKLYDLSAAGALAEIHEQHVSLIESSNSRQMYKVCGVRFLDEGADTLLVGTTNGLVRLFDLRTTGEQARFEYQVQSNFPNVPKSITCFDRNANGRIICCGTEQYMQNTYMLFYDVRECKQLGGFFESHQDDLTSVRFHDSNPSLLCSGGTDGLINVYDIKELNEDDALLNTINTESSVSRLNWHRNVYEQDIISCITHTNDFMTYESQEGDEIVAFDRAEITEGILRKNPGNFNLINAHSLEDNSIFLLAGTNFNKGEILRSVTAPAKSTLEPLTNFVGNKQIVRESLYDAKRDLLVTGGESGIITIWTPETQNDVQSNKLKSKAKSSKTHKKNPY